MESFFQEKLVWYCDTCTNTYFFYYESAKNNGSTSKKTENIENVYKNYSQIKKIIEMRFPGSKGSVPIVCYWVP